jgi:two-component system OmpR family response regulator
MGSRRIYIADDEQKILEIIKMFLKKEGYEVEAFSDGETLLEAFKETPCDMAIIDIMMPGIDGLSVCTEIRKTSNVPIIMISAKDSDSDKIAGLMLGSDDYMAKPFSPVELVLRVKSIFRRTSTEKEAVSANTVIRISDVDIYVEGKYAACGSNKIKFTTTEFNLLQYLAQNVNRGVSREELLNKVWGFNSEVDTRAADDMLKRIRKKLADAGASLKIDTLWGFGFVIYDKE